MNFVPLIKKSRIENEIHFLMNQPAYVAVGQLGRITLWLAGNRFNSKLIDFPVGKWRQYNLIPQLCKESEPKRIIFIHVQHTGNSNSSSSCLIRGERFIAENTFQLVIKKIGGTIFALLFSESALTAVSWNILSSACKFINGKTTAVGTAFTFGHACFKLQSTYFFKGEHGSLITFYVTLPCNKGSAKGTHNPCNIGTDSFAVRDFFKAS